LRNCVKNWERIRECAKRSESVPKPDKVWESVIKVEKVKESGPRLVKVWESVLKVEKVCLKLRKGA